ncbi:uncharacterized protein [Elaeis guineensis]|uniref:uncharacterized protein isoform X2 n=1 Tax=Elaeis guineensis var. tenera TaxID=51953 RepID=UPI003C6D09BB
MPPRKASTWRPMASAARSQALASPPVFQAPPSATAIETERSDNRPSTDFANTISDESRRGAIGVFAGPPKRQKIEESITFTEEDAQKVQFPHNDAVVVSLNIANYEIHRILVDNRSSIDILFYDVFSRMPILDGHLGPISSPLVGFTGDAVPVEGVITLTVAVGRYPRQSRALVNFLVVKAPSAYNAILGRPDLNALRAIVSTYHLKLKFPTNQGVGEVRGDQALARRCYNIALQRSDQFDLCPVDGLDAHDDLAEERGGPIEDLVSIPLNDGNAEHVVKIGSNLGEEVQTHLVDFVLKNADIFAWVPADMPGIDMEVVEHRLAVDPKHRSMKENIRGHAPERQKAIAEEVDKLLKAGFIREVSYSN